MITKDRIQINVQLSLAQMEQVQILAVHYGSLTTAVRVALDLLWREHVRTQTAMPLEPSDKSDNALS